MATTFVDYTGDGNATKQFTFPSIQESDIKVDVDGVIKSSGTHYNITGYTTTGGGNVVFTSGNIPASPAAIRIFRDTNVDSAKATYTAGSSVKAADLNANHEQLMFAAQEEQNQTVLTSGIKDGAVTSAKIKDGTIVNADINASAAIDGSKLAASTTSAAGSMSAADKTKLDGIETAATADQTAAEIRTLVESATDSNVFTDADHTKLNGIETGATADQTNAEIRAAVEAATDSNVFTDADHSKLNAIEAGATADQTASEIKTLIASSPLDSSHLAANSVTTSEIADGELTTLAGMQSTTASNLASSTALTATTAELNQLDGITLETSLTTNSDTRIPTSKAVNDQILAVTNALGGFVAIADEISFPTSNPDPSNNTGTVVSISQITNKDASGNTQNRTVNGSGVLTIPNAAGSNTVTITGFPSNLQNQTLSSESGLQVQTTSTLHTYTFHKQLASAADIQAISATVNSFSNRYRVSASAPTSSLDGGDLWYDTTNSKLMVYSSQNSAWEESSAIGNFFISTISSSSNTGGGSATANGTAYRFTISDAPVSAQQLLVSVDGVIQKPNSGSSQPSEGFVLVGNDIIFGAAPANGASLFVTVIGSTVGIGTPSNNTVTTAILQNGSVTTAKIVDANVTTAKLGNEAVTNAKLGDLSISNTKVASNAAIAGTKISPNFGSQNIATTGTIGSGDLTITSGAPFISFVDSDHNSDFNIQINAGSLNFNDTTNSATRMSIASDGTVDVNGNLDANSGLDVTGNTTVAGNITPDADGIRYVGSNSLRFAKVFADVYEGSGANLTGINTDLVSDTTPQLGGNLDVNAKNIVFGNSSGANDDRLVFGASSNFLLFFDGSDGAVQVTDSSAKLRLGGSSVEVVDEANSEVMAKFISDGACELYNNNQKKLNTRNAGIDITGDLRFDTSVTGGIVRLGDNQKIFCGSGDDLQIYAAGSNSVIAHNGDGDLIITTADGEKIYFDSSEFNFRNASSNETLLKATQNGAVELYYDNVKRFETTSTGCRVNTGDIRFVNSSWTGEASEGKIQNHGGVIYIQGGSHSSYGILFRDNGGTDRFGMTQDGHLQPTANNTYDLGTSSYRWRNIYTNDLNLSNEGSSNEVDGTWGDWTIQEGESDLFLKNNRSGKKYKFNLTEVS